MSLRRREFSIEGRLDVPKPTKAELEVLGARAAKLAYLNPLELSQLLQEQDELLNDEKSDESFDFDEKLSQSKSSLASDSSTQYLANLCDGVSPLLKLINGTILMIYDSSVGSHLVMFNLFGELWVSFRGTQVRDFSGLFRDIETDLRCRQKQTSYLPDVCSVHSGFDKSYMSLREPLWEEIRERAQTNRKKLASTRIRFIGHSLGGALATLAAVDFNFNAEQRSANFYRPSICDSVVKISCRSFGCPHVGNQDFVNLFNSEVKDAYRYAIQFDPIPLLLNPISSYGHVDEKIEIPDLLGKHKIEYYIIVLVRWFRVSRWSHVTIKSHFHEFAEIKEEENFNSDETDVLKMIFISIPIVVILFCIYRKIK